MITDYSVTSWITKRHIRHKLLDALDVRMVGVLHLVDRHAGTSLVLPLQGPEGRLLLIVLTLHHGLLRPCSDCCSSCRLCIVVIAVGIYKDVIVSFQVPESPMFRGKGRRPHSWQETRVVSVTSALLSLTGGVGVDGVVVDLTVWISRVLHSVVPAVTRLDSPDQTLTTSESQTDWRY